ncbi:MAG: glycoside hydrolase family 31 protein [Polyangiaceae bacterium]
MSRVIRASLAWFCASITLAVACSDVEERTSEGTSGTSGTGGTAGAAGTSANPCEPRPVDSFPVPKIHTPRWAFEPWISKDISTTDDTREFVKGFEDREIPVGVVVLDSPWETQYNTFIPSPTRYPGFKELLDELHGKQIKMVLWMTQMVNDSSFDLEKTGDKYDGPSPNFLEGQDCGFYVNDGETMAWWKGDGSAIDFFNDKATTWWHAQQDTVLDMGIDGWKLDFGDSYLKSDPVKTAQGDKPHQEYSEAYYRDFWAYGVSKRGPDFVTMVRPYDKSYGFEGRFYARPENAPVTWVGDNRRDWEGLTDALDEIFRSADAGYVVIGSDIGGYLDFDDTAPVPTPGSIPFDTLVFARWTALGAMTPFMQLHGRANIAPWTVPDNVDETVALYKYWATLHHEMVPFFYSVSEEAYAGHTKMIATQGTEQTWPGDYRFVLGDSLLVAPMLDDNTERDVELPAGSKWYDWWADDADALEGGQTITSHVGVDRAKIPLFLREGAIVPLDVASDVTGIAGAWAKNDRTLLVVPSSTESRTFITHDEDDQTSQISTSMNANQITIQLSRTTKTTALRVRVDTGNSAQITVNGQAPEILSTPDDGTTAAMWSEAAKRVVWVRVPASSSATTITIGG